MRGVVIKRAFVIAEDERRKIISILNGQLSVKDIHILFMKDGKTDKDGFVELPLGNHKHWYAEVMYVMKGEAHYWLKNKEEEEMQFILKEGDIMFRAPEVVHTCKCTPDCILIDGATEAWIDEDWNHVREELV